MPIIHSAWALNLFAADKVIADVLHLKSLVAIFIGKEHLITWATLPILVVNENITACSVGIPMLVCVGKSSAPFACFVSLMASSRVVILVISPITQS